MNEGNGTAVTLNRKAIIVLLAKLAVSVALLVLVLAKVNVGSVISVLSKANVPLVLLWYSLIPITVAFSAWRWQVLAPGLSYMTAMKYTWIGVFFGHVLPGSIAGDVAKGVSLALKDSNARNGLAASIVAEKVIGLLALLLFFDIACAVVYLLYGETTPQIRHLALLALALSLAGIVGAIAAGLVAVRKEIFAARDRSSLFGRVATGIGAATKFYSNKPSLIGRAFVISMIIHVVNILATYLSFRALRLEGDLLFASVVYPIVSVMLLIPISVSGIGVRDATLALLFTLFGLPAESGVALSWLALLAVIPNVMIGGAIQLVEMYRKH